MTNKITKSQLKKMIQEAILDEQRVDLYKRNELENKTEEKNRQKILPMIDDALESLMKARKIASRSWTSLPFDIDGAIKILLDIKKEHDENY